MSYRDWFNDPALNVCAHERGYSDAADFLRSNDTIRRYFDALPLPQVNAVVAQTVGPITVDYTIAEIVKQVTARRDAEAAEYDERIAEAQQAIVVNDNFATALVAWYTDRATNVADGTYVITSLGEAEHSDKDKKVPARPRKQNEGTLKSILAEMEKRKVDATQPYDDMLAFLSSLAGTTVSLPVDFFNSVTR